MGMLNTLRGYNIKFNPRPWADTTQPTVNAKPVVKTQNVAPVQVQDRSFVDLHLEVSKKVDALIAQMEEEGKFDNWDAPSIEDVEVTPEQTELEKTVLRN